MIIENAMIEKTFLGVEDHGCFIYILYLKYGSGNLLEDKWISIGGNQ